MEAQEADGWEAQGEGCGLRVPKPVRTPLRAAQGGARASRPAGPQRSVLGTLPGFGPLHGLTGQLGLRENPCPGFPAAFLFLGSGRGRAQSLGVQRGKAQGAGGCPPFPPLPPLHGAVAVSARTSGGTERCPPGAEHAPSFPSWGTGGRPTVTAVETPEGGPGGSPSRPARRGLCELACSRGGVQAWAPGGKGTAVCKARPPPGASSGTVAPQLAPVGEKQADSRGSD